MENGIDKNSFLHVLPQIVVERFFHVCTILHNSKIFAQKTDGHFVYYVVRTSNLQKTEFFDCVSKIYPV